MKQDANLEICRTCLREMSPGESFKIGDETERMLKFCSPKINLRISKDPYICLDCLNDLTGSHYFKQKCKTTETRITAFLSSHQQDTVDLRIVRNMKCEIVNDADDANVTILNNRTDTNNRNAKHTVKKTDMDWDINCEIENGMSIKNEDIVDLNTFMESLSTQEFYEICSSDEEDEKQNLYQKNTSNGISKDRSRVAKYHFCLFCQKKATNIPRHFIRWHKIEESVKEFLKYAPGSRKRKHLLQQMRKEGDYLHFKETGEAVSGYDILCPYCRGGYTNTNFRNHQRECKRKYSCIMNEIHEVANNVLRRKIYPNMKKDYITTAVKQDKIINLYGNELTASKKFVAIKTNMRNAGRFFIKLMRLNEQITSMDMIFNPKYVDDVIKTVYFLTGYDPVRKIFKRPVHVSKFITMLKKMSSIYLDMCGHDKELRRQVYTFIKAVRSRLMDTDMGDLPFTGTAQSFVDSMRSSLTKLCSETISPLKLLELCKQTLVLVILINRGPVVEIKRAKLSDVESFQECDDALMKNHLSPLEYNKNIDAYQSFTVVKKDSDKIVIVDPLLKACLTKIADFRKKTDKLSSSDLLFPQISNLQQHYLLSSLLEEYCEKYIADNEKSGGLKEELSEFRRRLHVAEFHFNNKLLEEAATSTGNPDKAVQNGEVELHDGITDSTQTTSRGNNSSDNAENNMESSDLLEPEELNKSSNDMDLDLSQEPTDSKGESDSFEELNFLEFVKPSVRNRIRWSNEERNAVKTYFKDYFSDDSITVSYMDCQLALINCKELSNRTIPQLKVWLAEEKKRMKRDKELDKKGVVRKRGWAASEIECLKKHFKKYINRQVYPSTEECAQLILTEPVLKNRTPEIIKSKLQHEYRIQREGKRRSDLD